MNNIARLKFDRLAWNTRIASIANSASLTESFLLIFFVRLINVPFELVSRMKTCPWSKSNTQCEEEMKRLFSMARSFARRKGSSMWERRLGWIYLSHDRFWIDSCEWQWHCDQLNFSNDIKQIHPSMRSERKRQLNVKRCPPYEVFWLIASGRSPPRFFQTDV